MEESPGYDSAHPLLFLFAQAKETASSLSESIQNFWREHNSKKSLSVLCIDDSNRASPKEAAQLLQEIIQTRPKLGRMTLIVTAPLGLIYQLREHGISSRDFYMELLHPVALLDQDGQARPEGFAELRELLYRRSPTARQLIEPADLDALLRCSGGLPGLLLSLVREAVIEAQVREEPILSHEAVQ